MSTIWSSPEWSLIYFDYFLIDLYLYSLIVVSLTLTGPIRCRRGPALDNFTLLIYKHSIVIGISYIVVCHCCNIIYILFISCLDESVGNVEDLDQRYHHRTSISPFDLYYY